MYINTSAVSAASPASPAPEKCIYILIRRQRSVFKKLLWQSSAPEKPERYLIYIHFSGAEEGNSSIYIHFSGAGDAGETGEVFIHTRGLSLSTL